MPKTKLSAEPFVVEDDQLLSNQTEVSCFIACLQLVNQLRALGRAFQGAEISRRDFLNRAKELLERLSERVAATEQFDIVMPVLGDGQFSPYFWRWFNWWDDYFHGLMATTAEAARLRRQLRSAAKESASKRDWFACRDTPAFSLPQAL